MLIISRFQQKGWGNRRSVNRCKVERRKGKGGKEEGEEGLEGWESKVTHVRVTVSISKGFKQIDGGWLGEIGG